MKKTFFLKNNCVDLSCRRNLFAHFPSEMGIAQRLPVVFYLVVLGISCATIVVLNVRTPEIRNDSTMSYHPYICCMVWSGGAWLPIANKIVGVFSDAEAIEYSVLLLLGGWVWNWVIIAAPSTWTILQSTYSFAYIAIILFQSFYIVLAVCSFGRNQFDKMEYLSESSVV